MTETIRAIQFGCGPIGRSIARAASQRRDVRLVGAIDRDPAMIGRDLADLDGRSGPLGVVVTDDLGQLVAKTKPQVAFHATGSRLAGVREQLAQLLQAGLNVVSTCEELTFPYGDDAHIAADLGRIASDHGVSILSTGINPGFIMDSWPLFMTGVCQKVERIRVERVQDAGVRRLPFQQKIGAGRTLDEFQELLRARKVQHVGLTESVAMIAAGLGWELSGITEEVAPIIADDAVRSEQIEVPSGHVAGARQVGRGFSGGVELITLEFLAYIGAPRSYDAVHITGVPTFTVEIDGGVHGDVATAAIVVNAARRVVEARPGLITMKDLPLVSAGQ
ncbi:MAG: hypothetical protein QOH08_531 [Chloroflexota bacterium]|jgi:4-hydroxy-tetrahydrodipicolinate reductase|nr:hypothetical protein [Chloroflexota bacterium]